MSDFTVQELTLGQLLENTAARFPDTDAVIHADRELRQTWSEFSACVDDMARGLMAIGVQKGEKVAVWATNVPHWVTLMFATARIGAILVTVNTNYRETELRYLLQQSECENLFIIDSVRDHDFIASTYEVLPELRRQRTILFVGTKKQAQDAIKTEAERCGMYYVNERWLGGMLTNFKTIQSRIKRLKEIETMSEDGTFDVLPKKEVIELKKEWAKLEKNLGGIKDMKRLPDAIFIVDPKKERICVQEAHTLGIPLIGICDTNCDPEELDYVIPGNDDAIRAVKLIVSKMADAVIEANQGATDEEYYEAETAVEAEEAVEE